MSQLYKIQATGLEVDLDTAFITLNDAHQSELAARLGRKPDRLQGLLQALVTREDGTQFPQILEVVELAAKGPKQRRAAELAINSHFHRVVLPALRAQALSVA